MKIAFLTTEYVTEQDFDGGLSNYLYRICHVLKLRGHHVEIFTLSDHDEEFYHEDLLIHRVYNRTPIFEFLNRLSRYKLKRTFRFLSISYSLNKRLRQRQLLQQFDIVQAASCFACGLFSTFKRRIPVVTRISSYEPLFREFYQKPLNFDQQVCERLELLAMERSDAVFTPSRFLSKVLLENNNLLTDVILSPFYLENELLDESIYRDQLWGKKYFLFFGAVGYLKGGEIIADALPLALNKIPDMHFIFVGKNLPGPNGKTMMDHIVLKAGEPTKRIMHFEPLTHQKLYPIIKNAVAVVLPSLVDNLPNAMIEAMGLGKVVIGTHGTSFEELIDDGVSGILIERNNPKALLDAMLKIWNMAVHERIAIGERAMEKTRELLPEIICGKMEAYFNAIITEKSGPPYRGLVEKA